MEQTDFNDHTWRRIHTLKNILEKTPNKQQQQQNNNNLPQTVTKNSGEGKKYV